MKTTIPAILLPALALPAFAQLTFQAGNYTTSITGATFVHNGGAIPGLSTGEVAQCGSSHIHAVIPGFGNPNTTCGHGTPIFLSPLTVAPSGATSNSAASMLSSPGSMPNSAAGQLALTRPSMDAATAGEMFLFAFGAATGSSMGHLPRAKEELDAGRGNFNPDRLRSGRRRTSLRLPRPGQ